MSLHNHHPRSRRTRRVLATAAAVTGAVVATASAASAMSHAPAISARDVTTRLRPELTATTNGAPVLGGLTSGG